MQTQVYPYLTFNGTCREAMHFYQKCLGGELYFQTIGESGETYKGMPKKMSRYILHSSLISGHFKLMGSDLVGDEGLVRGNSVSISLLCSDKSLMNKYFKRLSENGRNLNPIRMTKWGTYFGSLTDKFNNNWLFTCYPN